MTMMRAPGLAPRLQREWRQGVESIRILPRRSWKAFGAALAALLYFTFKDVGAVLQGINHFGLFEAILLVLLAAGWLLWLTAGISEFFGTETVTVDRGALINSRGIGPLRRTFRYPVRDLAELTCNDPHDYDHNDLVKVRPRHIFLRAKSGAISFRIGDQTHYCAQTLDEQGGEALLRWLQARLPKSAQDLVLGDGFRL